MLRGETNMEKPDEKQPTAEQLENLLRVMDKGAPEGYVRKVLRDDSGEVVAISWGKP